MRMMSRHILIDANVLVYAALEESEMHMGATAAISMLAAEGCELWVTRQIVREFCRAMLGQSGIKHGMERSEVAERAREILSKFNVAAEDEGTISWLLRLVASTPFPARVLHDANIVATMLHYGIPEILTYDAADFGYFSGLIGILNL